MRKIWGAFFCLLAANSLAEAQSIRVAPVFDGTADFEAYDTYEFLPGRVLSTNEPIENRPLDRQIVEAILDEIKKRGGREDTANPDVYVTYFFGLESHTWVSKFDGFRPYQAGGPKLNPYLGQVFESEPSVALNYKGVLVIDLIDAAKNTLAWRAFCTAKIGKPLEPAKRMNLIRKAVRKAFDKYPPKVKK